jgi:hypothetical protein
MGGRVAAAEHAVDFPRHHLEPADRIIHPFLPQRIFQWLEISPPQGRGRPRHHEEAGAARCAAHGPTNKGRDFPPRRGDRPQAVGVVADTDRLVRRGHEPVAL